MTQRPSTWFNTHVGRAIQGNCDAWWCGAQQPRELNEVADALELSDEEKSFVRKAGIGMGLLVSGQRRVTLDLYDKLSPAEYQAFHSDPVLAVAVPAPIPVPREPSRAAVRAPAPRETWRRRTITRRGSASRGPLSVG